MSWNIGKSRIWILLVILVSLQGSIGLRILGILPFTSKSHFGMTGGLMRGLAKRGHQVDVYSHFPLDKPMANYTDYSLKGSMPMVYNNMSYELFQTFAGGPSIKNLLAATATPICDLLNLPIFQRLIRSPPKDPPYDLVIVEIFTFNCYLAFGRHLKVPMIGVSTTSSVDWLNDAVGNPVNLATDPSVFSSYVPPMTFLQRVHNVLQYTYSKWSFSYHVREQDAIVRKMFGPNYPNVMELEKDFALVFVNYPLALLGVRPFTPSVVPLAAIHVVDDDNSLSKVK